MGTMWLRMLSASQKQSPYTLSECGEYLLRESGGDKCVDANKAFLYGVIEKGLHSTPYDVERGALRAIGDLFRAEGGRADAVKNYIYNVPGRITVNGTEYEITDMDVEVSMAFYLRDMYLSEKMSEAAGR